MTVCCGLTLSWRADQRVLGGWDLEWADSQVTWVCSGSCPPLQHSSRQSLQARRGLDQLGTLASYSVFPECVPEQRFFSVRWVVASPVALQFPAQLEASLSPASTSPGHEANFSPLPVALRLRGQKPRRWCSRAGSASSDRKASYTTVAPPSESYRSHRWEK